MCLILNDLNVMGMLIQVLEIIFEMQRKMNNEKIIRKIVSQITKHFVFL